MPAHPDDEPELSISRLKDIHAYQLSDHAQEEIRNVTGDFAKTLILQTKIMTWKEGGERACQPVNVHQAAKSLLGSSRRGLNPARDLKLGISGVLLGIGGSAAITWVSTDSAPIVVPLLVAICITMGLTLLAPMVFRHMVVMFYEWRNSKGAEE